MALLFEERRQMANAKNFQNKAAICRGIDKQRNKRKIPANPWTNTLPTRGCGRRQQTKNG